LTINEPVKKEMSWLKEFGSISQDGKSTESISISCQIGASTSCSDEGRERHVRAAAEKNTLPKLLSPPVYGWFLNTTICSSSEDSNEAQKD